MSSTAHGVIAVKQCRFPPLFGYKIDVLHGAVRTLSTVNLANLTVKQAGFHQNDITRVPARNWHYKIKKQQNRALS